MANKKWSDYFIYDESSPSFLRWKVDRVSGRNKTQIHVKAGDVAGCPNKNGYYNVKIDNRLTLCHRIIYEMCNDLLLDEHQLIDHIDGNPYNNKRNNLRIVLKQYNARNAKKRVDNTSGVTGVTKISNGCGNFYWSARCEGLDGKIIQKRFSIKKFGNEKAFELACKFREDSLEELNLQGAGYTETHGLRD